MGGKGIIRAGPLVSGFRVGAGKVGYQESCNTPKFVHGKRERVGSALFWRVFLIAMRNTKFCNSLPKYTVSIGLNFLQNACHFLFISSNQSWCRSKRDGVNL